MSVEEMVRIVKEAGGLDREVALRMRLRQVFEALAELENQLDNLNAHHGEIAFAERFALEYVRSSLWDLWKGS